jgi:hypothetical protein
MNGPTHGRFRFVAVGRAVARPAVFVAGGEVTGMRIEDSTGLAGDLLERGNGRLKLL